MGFGAVFGMLSGLGLDLIEEDELRREDEKQRLREIAWIHEILSEHYARRMELHPNRDIYPADWFFESDSSKLKPEARLLVRHMNGIPIDLIGVASHQQIDHTGRREEKAVTKSFCQQTHAAIEQRN